MDTCTATPKSPVESQARASGYKAPNIKRCPRTGLLFVRFQKSGRRHEFSLKTRNLKIARRKAEQFLAQVDEEGVVPTWVRDRRVTFEVAYDRFLKTYASTKSSSWYQMQKEVFKPIFVEHFGSETPVRQIGAQEVESLIQSLLDKPNQKGRRRTAPRVNRYLIGLRVFFNKQVAWGTLKRSPMEKVKKLPEDTSRAPRALSHGEVRALFAVAEGTPYKTYVALAVFTGMRPSEILTLRWKAVAFAQRQIHVQSTSTNPTKNHRSRILPMAPELEAVLSGLPEGEPESLVFAGPDGKPISRFTVLPAVKRLFDQAKPKIKDANLYSLRHSFGTLMAERGVPIQDLQAMMGHSSITVTARYLHPLRLRAGTLPTLSFAQPEKPVVPVNSAAGA